MNQSRKRHRFTAHLRDEGVHGRQWVASADSFIDAAIQFAENAALAEGDVSIVVTDTESGKDRCFVVNVGTGDVQSC
jgi:hypothetical protein